MLRSAIRCIRCCRSFLGKFAHCSSLGIYRPKTVSEFEKSLFLFLLCDDPLFHQFNEHTIGTESAAFCHVPDLGSHLGRKCDALTNTLFFGSHDTIMHQSGASRENLIPSSAASS